MYGVCEHCGFAGNNDEMMIHAGMMCQNNQPIALHRHDYKGKGVPTEHKTTNAYIYAPVNIKTGEVDTSRLVEFDDMFDELQLNWVWAKLYLSLEEPNE